MNFKNRLTTDNLLTSTNLVIAVCILTIILVLYKSCSEEKPKAPPEAAKKEVLRLAMPEDSVPVSPGATGNLNPDIPAPSLEAVMAGAGFYVKNYQKPDTPVKKDELKKEDSLREVIVKDDSKNPDAPGETAIKETIKKTDARNKSPEMEDLYKVAKGETLYEIAGKKHVYGDRLKWPSLYRHNMEVLERAGVVISDKLPETVLPEGLELKFITARQAKKNAASFSNKSFVVNAISTRNPGTVVLPTVSLIKKGYNVYLVSAEVKGKNWLRLRAGFFENRKKASDASREIMKQLNINDAWVAKLERGEFQKYAGY